MSAARIALAADPNAVGTGILNSRSRTHTPTHIHGTSARITSVCYPPKYEVCAPALRSFGRYIPA